MVGILIGIAIFAIIFFIGYSTAADKDKKYAEAAKQVIMTKRRPCCIKVEKRTPANHGILTISEYRESHYEYTPTTATYTSATVGGVTTGGVTVDEAHYSEKIGKLTKKYGLFFEYHRPDSVPVEVKQLDVSEVELSLDDAKLAYSDDILREFVEGNKLKLRHNVQSKNAEMAMKVYAHTGNYYDLSNMLQGDALNSSLTEEEMKKVLSFLCGES